MTAGKGLLVIVGGTFALVALFAVLNPDGGGSTPAATTHAPDAIPESAVTVPCRGYIEHNARHDVKYPVLEQVVKTSAKGGMAVIGFRANNAFNAWTHYTAVCIMDQATGKLDAQTYEASFLDTVNRLASASPG